MLQIVKALCEDAGHELAYLDGQTPGPARQGIVDAFNAPGSRAFVFLVSTHAGGVGLNITAANRVVIVDPDWSPAKDLQAMARAVSAAAPSAEPSKQEMTNRNRPADQPTTHYLPTNRRPKCAVPHRPAPHGPRLSPRRGRHH